jgi:hypothetical protein
MKMAIVVGMLSALTLLPCVGFSASVWPLAPQNQTHKMWNAYGEYAGSTPHFHEAIDLPADSTEKVFAADSGFVVQRRVSGINYYQKLSITMGSDTTEAWKYLHMIVGMHPTQPRLWQIGDTVAVGDSLGTVAVTAGILRHLHFEWQNDAHPASWDTTDPSTVADINGNPIDLLSPVTDGIQPVGFTPFHYRPQSGEGNPNASYFTSTTASGRKVIKDNVDIIARGYDRFGSFSGLNYDLNVREIEFEVMEMDGSAHIPYQEAENFSGLFLQAPDGRNSFAKFRDSTRVKVIYEDDNTCKSVFPPLSGGLDSTRYFYILSNIDDDYDLETSDANRYWDTDGKEGEPWNDNRDSTDHEASNNADAAFPDGEYSVTVALLGQSYSSKDDDMTVKLDLVFINNHDETIESCDHGGATKNYFQPKEKVYVRGEGFPKNRGFTIYVVRNTAWSDGMAISGIITTTTVTTTDSGTIDPTQVWDEYAPNGDPDVGYDMVVDYDDDVKYTAPKESFIVEALDDADVEYNAGLRSKKPKVVITPAGHTRLRLTWTEPWDSLGIQRYIILRSTNPNFTGDTLGFSYDTTYTDYYVTGNPYYNYFYTVSAENVVGEEVWVSGMVGEFDRRMVNEMK